ncbi:MAG: hypothetical protein ABR567_04830 [Myxococcales bacterium]|nr:hypothetical protein [Myxococcales bacterium]
MGEPLSDDELAELEKEARAMAQWALDEADVRRLQLRRRAFEELRALRAEVVERRAAEISMRQHLENIEAQLAKVKRGRR